MPDLGTMQTIALSLALVGSGLAFLNITVGLYSAMTGADHWPQRLRRIRRRTPATADDHRVHGLGMLLGGCAVLMVLIGVTLNTLAIGDRVGEPEKTMRFVISVIVFAASLACMIGANGFSSRVKYLYRDSSSHKEVQT